MSGIDITCPYCHKHFRIDTKHIRQATFPARCGSCKQIFNLDGPALLRQAAAQHEQSGNPAFLCLVSGEEWPATLREMKGEEMILTLRHSFMARKLESLDPAGHSLRVGLHQADTSWEYFITFACHSVQINQQNLFVRLATLPGQPWLVVEEHGVYLHVVRSGGTLEGGWKPLKPNQIPADAPLPKGEKSGLVLCGKFDAQHNRMQYKPYPLTDLLAIQHIARERQLLEPVPEVAASSSLTRQDKTMAMTSETLFRHWGQQTSTWNMPSEQVEQAHEEPILTNQAEPPVTSSSEEEEEEEDITAKDITQRFPKPPPPQEEYTAREDFLANPAAADRQDQQSHAARQRWVEGRLGGKYTHSD